MKCWINTKLECREYGKTTCQTCETFLKNGQTIMELYKKMPKKKEGSTSSPYVPLAKSWIEQKREQLKQERKTAMKAKGMMELYNMPIGETEITIDTNITPRKAETKFGDRDVLRITVNGSACDWMINPKSPLYRELLEHLYEDKNHFIIVRSGLEKQTRYSIKKAW